MADNITSECKISARKDTLCAQQNLLQKLYNELDAEREASASAASEALSVILRLQGEKAAVKLEAEQYKRLSEEKMSHAEESLAIIEDIIYQKEMEIAALDCQVQAYRYKLLSLGCADFSNTFQENGNLGSRNSGLNSFKYKNAVNEKDGSCLREMDCDEASNSSIDSYWEQIRKLDVRVKEIAGGNYANLCDLSNSANLRVEYKVAVVNENNADLLKNGVGVDYYPCSSSVHDVFEVPQVDRDLSSWESREKDENETVRKDVVVVHPEDVEEKLYVRDEPEPSLCALSEAMLYFWL